MIIGEYNKSVILTYIGALLSLCGIILSVSGYIPFAVICLVLAGICDLFDGVIARRIERTESAKQFGVQIDSLVDVVSFLAFPCVLGIYLLQPLGIFGYFILGIYLLCGIIRLAWFNVHTAGKKDHYTGLPVTYAALVLPIIYAAALYIIGLRFIFGVVYIVLAILFVLNISIKKPTGVWYIIFGVLAVLVIGAILLPNLII